MFWKCYKAWQGLLYNCSLTDFIKVYIEWSHIQDPHDLFYAVYLLFLHLYEYHFSEKKWRKQTIEKKTKQKLYEKHFASCYTCTCFECFE